ncbi:hypothetical protein [Hymenobacter psoromatis]|uniref:hypothetical protein n=1 Tax=Hymenobacter psoromatis TaxID=1484116 RepID=UPI001CBBF2CF|nr:hypothetical protein [Hymenobacter psoromatis]
MKKLTLLLLLAATAGCQKHDPATDEFEVQTQGRNYDCGKAQVVVKDPEKVARVVGESLLRGNTYLALKLDTALWLHQNQTLLLRIRRPTDDESLFICHALGPAYPALTVVSARVKP